MTSIDRLSPSYAAARAAFVAAANRAGAAMDTTIHPLLGVDGEQLTIDVASFGPEDAANVVVVFCGTHGVEGYAGSALQRHWLETCVSERPDDVGLIMVHALNPYGFSWVRRVNEDNVDLNRNFIDWSATPPANPGYDRIADLLVPTEWTEAEQARTVTALLEVVAEIGMTRIQADVSGGQYDHPTGVFFGGNAAVWSHLWLRFFALTRLRTAKRIGIIDLHTGLGAWSYGELIGSESVASASHQRAQQWWGDVTSMVDGGSVSAPLVGDWLAVAADLAPQAEVTGVTIEYGTVDSLTVLQALRADAWLHSHGEPSGADGPPIRAAMRAAFADDDPAWIAALWPRFHEVLTAAFSQLTG